MPRRPHPVASTPAAAAATAPLPKACGALDCRLFDTPEEAFAEVLKSEPLVLAIGEVHAQRGHDNVPSATKRFTEKLLPMLRPRASDLILELWVADGSCGKRESQVASQQKIVTEKQASDNQNEFIKLGDRSKSLGIRRMC